MLEGENLAKLIIVLLVAGFNASSVIAQYTESVAMTRCLKTKSQLECNTMQSTAAKVVAKTQTVQQVKRVSA